MCLSAQLSFCNSDNMKPEIVLGKNYALKPVLYEKCFLSSGTAEFFPLFFRQCWLVTNHQYLFNFRLNDMTDAHLLRILYIFKAQRHHDKNQCY